MGDILIVVVASYLLVLIILLAIRSYTGGLHLDSGSGLLPAGPYHPLGHQVLYILPVRNFYLSSNTHGVVPNGLVV